MSTYMETQTFVGLVLLGYIVIGTVVTVVGYRLLNRKNHS